MSRRVWSSDRILEEIQRLHASGSDITQSRVEAIDSKLTSAAIRYFGSWRAAVEAAGIDYSRIAEAGRRRRSEKMTKWTRERILEEIKSLFEAGDDLSSSVVRRKHLALYATARRPEHFGSWSSAVAAAGIDYEVVKQRNLERRRQAGDWKKRLLLDWEADALGGVQAAEAAPAPAVSPSAAPEWARDLLHEKLMEIYESATEAPSDVPDTLRALLKPQDGGEESPTE